MDRFERWREVMQAAGDEQAVAHAVREYVASIPDTVISRLPPECQKALADHDIQRAAITLLHGDLAPRTDPSVAELLTEVAQTYAAASQRIAKLAKESLSAQGR